MVPPIHGLAAPAVRAPSRPVSGSRRAEDAAPTAVGTAPAPLRGPHRALEETLVAAPWGAPFGEPGRGGEPSSASRLRDQVRALADAQSELLQVVGALSKDITRLRAQQRQLQQQSTKPVELLSKDFERFQAQQQQQLRQLQPVPAKAVESLAKDVEHLRAQQQLLEQSQHQPNKVVEALSSDVDLLRVQLRQLQQLHEQLHEQLQQQEEGGAERPGEAPRGADGRRDAGRERPTRALEDEVEKCQAEARERHFASLRELARHWALLEELQVLQAESTARQRVTGEELAGLGASVDATRDEVSILVASMRRMERQLSSLREAELTRPAQAEAEMRRAEAAAEAQDHFVKRSAELEDELSKVSSEQTCIRQDISELSQIVAHLRSGHGEFASMCEDLRKEQVELKQQVADLDDQLWLTDERLGARIDDEVARLAAAIPSPAAPAGRRAPAVAAADRAASERAPVPASWAALGRRGAAVDE